MSPSKVRSAMRSLDAANEKPGWRCLAVLLFSFLVLTACGGSGEETVRPVTVEPILSEPAESARAEVDASTTTATESSTQEATMFDDPDFESFAARVLDTSAADLDPMQQYEIAGTACQAKVVGVQGDPVEAAVHFVITPSGETIAGNQPESVGRVLADCYDDASIEITSEQFVELVVNLGDTPGRLSPIDETFVSLLRRGETTYQPPTLEREGDELTFTFLARGIEFGDLIRVMAKRSGGSDLTVEYETLYTG